MIYIIIPTYGRTTLTDNFIKSIENNREEITIILTDDHPQTPTYRRYSNKKNIIVLTSKKELWWCGSINLGINYLTKSLNPHDSDICIFANNDVTAPAGTIDTLSELIKKNPAQIIHPITLNQKGETISSGARIKTWLPFITHHPKKIKEKTLIHLGTARMLTFSIQTLRKTGLIEKGLKQYHGDAYFTLKAGCLGIKTYITPKAKCFVDTSNDEHKQPSNIKALLNSFFNFTLPNHAKSKFILVRSQNSPLLSILILTSMISNTLLKYLKQKTTNENKI